MAGYLGLKGAMATLVKDAFSSLTSLICNNLCKLANPYQDLFFERFGEEGGPRGEGRVPLLSLW